MKLSTNLTILITTVTLALAGCASNPDSAARLATDAKQTETITQINTFKNTLDIAKQRYSTALSEQLDWYATQEIEEAQKKLEEAKEYYKKFEFDPAEANSSIGIFSSTTNLEAGKESLITFNDYMDRADTIKKTALTTLSEAFDYRDQLNKLDAQTHFPSTVKELETELKKLVDLVANDKSSDAIADQPILVAKQRALEIKVVSKVYLSDAQNALDKLLKTDISQHAPKALSDTSASLTATTAFVATNPRNIEEIKVRASAVLFAIRRAEQISLAVKKLKALPQKDYEDYLIGYENILLAIGKQLGAEDKRDVSFEQQSKALLAFIEADIQSKEMAAKEQLDQQNQLEKQAEYIKLLEEKVSTLREELAQMKVSADNATQPEKGIDSSNEELSQAEEPVVTETTEAP